MTRDVALPMRTLMLAAAIGFGIGVAATAAEPEPPVPPTAAAVPAAVGDVSLNQEASDPTASLLAVQIADWYTPSFYKLDGEQANTVVLRPVIPFSTGRLNHILRVTAPFVTHSPFLDKGLSDTTVFDLVVFNEKWGRWGIGPVALFPTGGSHRGTEKWALGPAVGFAARQGKLLWGVFNQNLFSFAGDSNRSDVDVSVLQPIFNYQLGSGWSAGVSEMTFTYDWEDGRWASLPLGVSLAKLVRIGNQPIQFNAQYEYDFADDEIGPQHTIRFTVKFLFPV